MVPTKMTLRQYLIISLKLLAFDLNVIGMSTAKSLASFFLILEITW